MMMSETLKHTDIPPLVLGLCPDNTPNMTASQAYLKRAENIHWPTVGQNHQTQSLFYN